MRKRQKLIQKLTIYTYNYGRVFDPFSLKPGQADILKTEN